MKKLVLLLAIAAIHFSFSILTCEAQAPNWLWARSASGPGNYYAYSVKADASGNIYIAGAYSSNITFGTFVLGNNDIAGNTFDLFLVKYNANGAVQWAKRAGGSGDDGANSIALDTAGNIYVTGSFNGPTLSFGTITVNNINNGHPDSFIAKYDTNGNVLWVKSAGGTNSNNVANAVATDNSGNAFLTGYFYGTTLALDSIILTNTSIGNADIFIAKYDESGNILWAKSAGGADDDLASSIAVDTSGNASVVGYFASSSITFFPTTLTNTGGYDLFLAKYDPYGNVLWARNAEGGSSDYAYSNAVDLSGNIYLAGYFQSSNLTFDTTSLTNAGHGNFFLAKYNAFGDLLWAKSAGGTKYDFAFSIAVDTSGNSYVAGYFNSPIIYLDSIAVTNDNTDIIYDLFVAEYDTYGNAMWAKGAGGNRDDYATSVALNNSGNIFLTGYFESFTMSFGSAILTASNYNIFLAKLGMGTGINELSNLINISVFPNPSSDNLSIETPPLSTIEILTIQGQLIKTLAASGNKTNIDVSAFPGGVYIVEVKTEKGVGVRKFVKN